MPVKMSKTKGKKLFQPIPLSAILVPTYQTVTPTLEKFQVEMDIPRSKFRSLDLQQPKKKAKTVHFDEENLESVVEFEDDQDSKSSRETYWEMQARDRVRFQDRIYRTEDILEPILMPCHRAKVFQERFLNNNNNEDAKSQQNVLL